MFIIVDAYRSFTGPVRTTLRVLDVPGGGGTWMSLNRRHGIGCGVHVLLFQHHPHDSCRGVRAAEVWGKLHFQIIKEAW
ncbi:MAG: hypothetical protein ACP5I8_08915 [Phycisphaerae bacterium]